MAQPMPLHTSTPIIRTACPVCDSVLQARSSFAGKTVRCPNCGSPFSIPGTPLPTQPPNSTPPVLPVSAASPPSSWAQSALATSTSGPSVPDQSEGTVGLSGRALYFEFSSPFRQASAARQAILGQMREVLDDEQLQFRIVDLTPRELAFLEEGAGAPRDVVYRPEPGDVTVKCRVITADFGSRVLRYVVPILPLFGPWACKLAITSRITCHGGEEQVFTAKAHQGIGIFGGSGEALMRRNIKIVSGRIGYRVTRVIARRWLINRACYDLALWSVIAGLVGMLPCFVLFGSPIVGLTSGGVSLYELVVRGLRRRRWMAIVGLFLNCVAMVVQCSTVIEIVRGK